MSWGKNEGKIKKVEKGREDFQWIPITLRSQSIYIMTFFFCLRTAAIATVTVLSKLKCKVFPHFTPSDGGDLSLVAKIL